MKNKFKILGVLIVMAIALCGAFNLSVPKYVFADETSVQETPINNDAGIFEGVGSYETGEAITLKATLKVGYEFYWLATYEDETSEILGSEPELSFEADRNITISAVTKKAGTFMVNVDDAYATANGTSFFIFGESATLTAVMEPGFKFTGWTAKTENGDDFVLPSDATNKPTDTTYSFKITQNIIVRPTWEKAKYSVTWETELDEYFDVNIINTTQATGSNYYDDKMQISITVKSDSLYVKDLAEQNVKVNNVDLYTIKNDNPMNVASTITNDSKGFRGIVITLDIKENVSIDIDYVKMFELSILSGNDIDIADIIEFVNPINTQVGKEYYGKINDATYLLYENVEMNLSLNPGDDIYRFESYQLQSMPTQTKNSVAITLSSAKTLTVTYDVVDYTISFKPYLQNANLDPMSENVYLINNEILKPGEKITYKYDESNKSIVVTNAAGSETYLPESIYGYKFLGFENVGELSGEHSVSSTNPSNAEIKMLFGYVEYSFKVGFNDDFFKPDVQLSVTDNKGLNATVTGNEYKLIKGTEITIKATSEKYIIKDWEFTNLEAPSGDASQLLARGYTFTFEPSDKTEYGITLDIDYKYTSAEFSLASNSSVYDVENTQYLAQLQISHIEKVNVVLTSQDTATVTFAGTTYSIDNSGATPTSLSQTNNKILEFNSDLVELETGKYELKYVGVHKSATITYNVHLFMAGQEIAIGDRIVLPNLTYNATFYTTEFVFNGTSFVLPTAKDAPATVEASVVADAENLKINLSNLLPSAVLIYSSLTNDAGLYKTTGFNTSGMALGCFDNDGYVNCLIPVAMFNNISVKYIKVLNKVYLQINNTNAYKHTYTTVTLNGTPAGLESTESDESIVGFEATDGDEVVISIASNSITVGYEFDEFICEFDGITLNTTEQDDYYVYTLSFKMKNANHANQIIHINFEEIEYNVKINVSNSGSVKIGEFSNNIPVTLSGSYEIIATAANGFYVSNAYISRDIDVNKLIGLISDNSSTDSITRFTLNSSNFEQLIIENANESNEVELNVVFTRHTYSVKAYFKIGKNEGRYNFPTVTIFGQEFTTSIKGEEDGSVVYYVQADSIESAQDGQISIAQDSFVEGITFDCLYYKDDVNKESLLVNIIDGNYTHNINAISSNLEYIIKLKYIEYTPEFIIVDTNGTEDKLLGQAQLTGSSAIILGSELNYSVYPSIGYIMDRSYYIDRITGEEVNIESLSIRDFNPIRFNITENNFTIFVAFTYKELNLQITSSLPENESKGAFVGKNPEELIIREVSRLRDGTSQTLTDQDGYVVRKGDIVTFAVKPISIGVALSSLSVGNVTYSNQSGQDLFRIENVYDEERKFVGIYYIVNVNFSAQMIEDLYNLMIAQGKNHVAVNNDLKIRTYNIVYTYNYIDSKFGVDLNINLGKEGIVVGQTDKPIYENMAFGTTASFDCYYDGKNTSTDKFIVRGFTVENDEFNTTSLSIDLDYWTSLALSKYQAGQSNVSIKLLLTPKIFLQNYDKNSPTGEYVYTKIYNAQQQGLNSDGAEDVLVGGGFEVIIQYSYNGGVSYINTKPINVGSYPVKLIAKITAEDSQPINIEYNEKVEVRINPKEITLTLKDYNQSNPVTKVYDGLKTISSTSKIVSNIQLNGLCDEDKGKVLIDANRVNAEFSGTIVNETSALYNLKVKDIYLIDKVNQPITNYVIFTGTERLFENVGKVLPRQLKISGIVAYNKVNDGSTTVQVNIDNLILSGKLQYDGTEIIKENLIFYHEEVDKNFKGSIEVKMDHEGALFGADSVNYTITYDPIIINIHLYELEVHVNGVGTFKIVDYDKKCLIPLDCKLLANSYAKGSNEYNKILSLTEDRILKSENLHAGYEIIVQIGGINQAIPEGLYICLPKVNKVTKVFQKINNQTTESVDYVVRDGYIVVKAQQGRAVFGVVIKTTYLPLWLIILIVAASLVGVGLIVLAFILIRRRSKRKYQRFDKI